MCNADSLSDVSTTKKSRSGTSRTYEERLAGGRPNVTFSLPLSAVEALSRLAEHYKLSRSAVVALAITELEKKIR